jgi:hypothetical protein
MYDSTQDRIGTNVLPTGRSCGKDAKDTAICSLEIRTKRIRGCWHLMGSGHLKLGKGFYNNILPDIIKW